MYFNIKKKISCTNLHNFDSEMFFSVHLTTNSWCLYAVAGDKTKYTKHYKKQYSKFCWKSFKKIYDWYRSEKIEFCSFKNKQNWNKYFRVRNRFETELRYWLDSDIFNEHDYVVSSLFIDIFS